jgi:hypothetical protein
MHCEYAYVVYSSYLQIVRACLNLFVITRDLKVLV